MRDWKARRLSRSIEGSDSSDGHTDALLRKFLYGQIGKLGTSAHFPARRQTIELYAGGPDSSVLARHLQQAANVGLILGC